MKKIITSVLTAIALTATLGTTAQAKEQPVQESACQTICDSMGRCTTCCKWCDNCTITCS